VRKNDTNTNFYALNTKETNNNKKKKKKKRRKRNNNNKNKKNHIPKMEKHNTTSL